MSDARTQIILAAVAASGERDEQWYSRVIANTRDIALMTSEKSDLARLVDSLIDESVKVFPATLIKVKKEESSTRAIAYFKADKTNKTEPQKDPISKKPLPVGVEFARTDRTDSEIGRSLAVQVQALARGRHRVLVFMKMERMDNGNNVRTLIGLVDQGATVKAEAA